MKKSDFDGLMKSMKEAQHFMRTGKIPGGRVHIPKEIDSAAIRAKAGLTQAAFAKQIGVSIATLRNWEQGRRNPDGPARVLLAMLAKDPNIVKRMLKSAA
jgi:putative transcriptional regulator